MKSLIPKLNATLDASQVEFERATGWRASPDLLAVVAAVMTPPGDEGINALWRPAPAEAPKPRVRSGKLRQRPDRLHERSRHRIRSAAIARFRAVIQAQLLILFVNSFKATLANAVLPCRVARASAIS
jgi:hypothetical protein